MLLVYAMTRATTDGWGAPADARPARRRRRARRSRSSLIEQRSRAPLLPLRIFRLRTLSAANVTMAIVGAVTFSEFFLLTLYLQDVLHYSADPERRRVRRLRADGRRRSRTSRSSIVGRVRRPRDAHRRAAALRRLARAAHAAAGGRALLLGSLPGLRARRRRPGPLVRPGDDREPARASSAPMRASPPASSTRAARSAARSASPRSARSPPRRRATTPTPTRPSPRAAPRSTTASRLRSTCSPACCSSAAVIAVTLVKPAPVPAVARVEAVEPADETPIGLEEAA